MAYTALNPEQAFDEWSKADKPYCFLRACLEVADIVALLMQRERLINPTNSTKLEEQFPDFVAALIDRGKLYSRGHVQEDGKFRFVSHLPIELDQSNSAFAHIGLLMGDEELQKKAGMGQEWSDVYTDIANEKGVLDKQGLKEAEKRKIIKKVSVPWSYGAGKQTCGDAIVKIVDENPNKYQYLKGLDIEEINDLAKDVIEVLEKRFSVCVDYQTRVQKAVTAAKRAGKESIEWHTPFGFRVVHRKYKLDERTDEVWGGDRWIYPKAYRPIKPSWEDLQTSTPAIFVHSMDAALIHGVLAYGSMEMEGSLAGEDLHIKGHLVVNEKGESLPIITIHDCFACHAGFAPDLQKILLRGLRSMYEYYEPFHHFLNTVENTGPIPMPRIDNSDYSWEQWAKNAFS
jgi:hypothetical protein